DPKTQRSLGTLETVTVIPVREVVLDEKTTATFAEKARKHAETRDLSRSKWAEPLEKVREGIPYPGIETELPLFYDRPTSFWDWLPEDAILVADDFAALGIAVEEHADEVKTIVSGKETLLSIDDALLSDRFGEAMEKMRRLVVPSLDTLSSSEV